MPIQTAKSLSKHLTQVLGVYGCAGFRIRPILLGGVFEKVRNLLQQIECNTAAAKEHVSEVERRIRTDKEQTRVLLAALPFEHLLWCMKIKFIYFMVLWINVFPVKNMISSVYLPRELLVRWRMDCKKHCQVLPGTYCEVHDKPPPSNTMTPQTNKAM